MAGKSTYMRQVAIITLMAHIGCFVPAKSAEISITDRIFTRVGASDDLAFGQSTFMVEMTEMANILNNATDNSLVILDEIGRGTSTFDGLSIAWAVVEHLSRTMKTKTLFATHYHELTELEGMLDGVKNYKINVKEINNNIVFLRKIVRGGASRSFGIEVAALAGLPQNIINRAKEISHNIEQYDFNLNLAKSNKVNSKQENNTLNENKNITIEQDLKRRDITINAIAQDVLTEEIIDPFNGKNDIKNKIIKATSESFKEDPLRVYRVARFAAKLKFVVDKNTLKLMNELKPELNTVSKERVFDEFRKALKTDKPSIFFDVLKSANVLQVHFLEIYNLIGAEQPQKYHPEGDSYNHTMEVIDRVCTMTNNLEIRYAALVHDLGKGITPKEMYPHHYGHDKKGVEVVQRFSNRIGVPNSWRKCGKTAAKEHMIGGIFWEMTPAKKVDFLERVNKSILGLEGLQIIVKADKNEKIKEFAFLKTEVLDKINGDYIKQKYSIKEGVKLKEKLRQERIKKMKEFE